MTNKTSTTKSSELKKKPGTPEWLFANIAEVSKSARKIYFLYIGFLFYCSFTVMGVEDRYIILNEEVHLPILNVDVPILGFFTMAPFVAIFVFIYLQLYLGRLKWLINLSTNYAPIEKGRLYPWMLNFPKDPESGFTKRLQKIIIKFSLWGLLPLVLGQFALLSARTHDPFYSYTVGVMPILGASIVLLFWFRYEGVQRKFIKFNLKNWGKIILVFLMFLFELSHLLYTIPESIRGNFYVLDLSYEKLITEPKLDYPGIYWGHFRGAHLEGAQLISTILKRADLRDAHLQHAIMNKVNLNGADLSKADLSYANLSYGSLSYANLNGADLSKAILTGGDLTGADLSEANLSEANLIFAKLNGADLIEADLSEADLSFANLNGASLSFANLNGAELSGANLSGANLSYAKNLTVAMIIKTRNWLIARYGTDLLVKLHLPLDHNKRVYKRYFSEYDFSKADLVQANLERADLSGATLNGANLSGANLERADLNGATLNGATLSGANLSGANLEGADLIKAILSGADLRGAELRGAKNLTIEQLSEVKTLYEAKLDAELMQQIIVKYPQLLLEEPKEEEEKEKD